MRSALFYAAMLGYSTLFAAAPIDGWYSSIFAGYTYMPDNIGITKYNIKRSRGVYNAAYNAGLRFGYQGNPLRYEGEFTYIQGNLSKIRINNIRQINTESSNTHAALGIANLYLDFPDMVPCVSPFLGGGLGFGWVGTDIWSHGQIYSSPALGIYGPVVRTHYTASNAVFAYQVTGGFTFNFSENWAANAAYRYTGTSRVTNLGKVFQANSVSVGVIYRFDGWMYK